MKSILVSISLMVFLQSGLVRTCIKENKILLKDTKNIKLAKSIGSQVKALNRSFSALTTLKKILINKKHRISF